MNVSIELSDEQLRRLENKAQQQRTSTEKLIEALVQEFADDANQVEFETAMDYVLRKNKELYERLAR